jgi:hypothetical protein
LTGKTTLGFIPVEAAETHRTAGAFASGTQVLKSYTDYTRTVPGGVTTTTGTLTSTYNGAQWSTVVTDVHRVQTGAFEVKINSTSSVVVTGSAAAGTRNMLSGGLRITETLSDKLLNVTISGLKWTNPACCQPSEGTIVAAGATANSTIEFGESCGSVSITTVDTTDSSAQPISQGGSLGTACE